jgi:hypothetical protein
MLQFKGKIDKLIGCKIAVGKLDFKKLRIVSLWELGGSFM